MAPRRRNKKYLSERAQALGLGVADYNPGDGVRYVVKSAPHHDYFGDGDVYRAGCNPGNVEAFLYGVAYAQLDLKGSILRNMQMEYADIAEYERNAEKYEPAIIERNKRWCYKRLEVYRELLNTLDKLA
jgi:hypothetical protein